MLLLIFCSLLTTLDENVRVLTQRISKYVVMVVSDEGNATGTIIDRNTVVTAGMFPDKLPVTLITYDDNTIEGVVAGVDEFSGIAVIKTTQSFNPPAGIKNPITGQLAIVYGNSLGTLGPVGLGIIQKDKNTYKIIVPLNPGNNGSGVFDMNGRLIGIIGGVMSTMSIRELVSLPQDLSLFYSGNVGIVIPYNHIKVIAGIISKKGSIRRAWLGVSLYERNGKVYIRDVVRGSPAERGGLKKNDIILYIDRKKITSMEDVASYIKSKKRGERIKIIVKRKMRKISLNITLGQAAPPLKYRNLHIKGPGTGSLMPQGSPPQGGGK